MATVILYNFERAVYRMPLVEEGELYCGHWVKTCRPPEWKSPDGPYDAAAFIKTLPAPWNDPTLLLVQYDIWGNTLPRGLSGIKCPKVLMVIDTHQLKSPIRRVIDYAKAERFDAICVQFNRQHIHFFQEAGMTQTYWLPCFELSPTEIIPRDVRGREIRFMGGYEKHPYRRIVLKALLDAGLPLEIGSGGPAEVAKAHSDAKICINASLNGDLNLRVMEVLAAGGFLLTDRLSPEAGLEMLLQDRQHLAIFDSPEQAIELSRYYLAHPEEAQVMARAGHAEYMRRHRPEQKVADLRAIMRGEPPADYAVRDARSDLPADSAEGLFDRIAVYEFLQTLHRLNAAPAVLFLPGLERLAADTVDLPRLKISVVPGRESGGAGGPLEMAGLAGRVEWVDMENLSFEKRKWMILVARAADVGSPLFVEWAEKRAGDLLVIAPQNPPAAAGELAVMQQMLNRYQPRLLNKTPLAYVFNGAATVA